MKTSDGGQMYSRGAYDLAAVLRLMPPANFLSEATRERRAASPSRRLGRMPGLEHAVARG